MTTPRPQQGSALIIVMVLFVALSLSIGTGLVAPVLRANRIATNTLESKRSYFIGESGVEDVVYRLMTGKTVSSTETLVLGSQTATTTVTDIAGGGKQIQGIGISNTRTRTIGATVSKGQGAAFYYGMQTGQGGITMSNGSGVVGNVYSNGSITGSGYVTGSAVSANSAALVADQQNGSGAPLYTLVFGNATATQDVAQSFQVSTTEVGNKIRLYIKKTGAPSNLTIRITSDNNGNPATTSLATGSLAASLVSTTYGWVDVPLSSNPLLTAGTTYWIVVDGSASASNYYSIGANTSYANGGAKIGQYSSSWSATTPSGLDIYFEVYLGGLQGLISGITVGTGTTGNAYAHTVTNSTIRGTNYCQTGTGNNKTCNTSLADPTPVAMPVSEQNIQDWKDAALAGGVYNGNYTVSGSATLGPMKITGNLSVTNNATLTVTGTLWVQGNITASNNGTIKLSSAYGSSSGVVVSDGTITIDNNGTARGSGTTGSYLMMLTTSNSTSAITVGNNAGTVILYAANGTVNVSNNAGAVEINGYKINLSNNAVVTYDSGLANQLFVDGPSGGWNLSSWGEQ